jgi:hypothetical protein
MATTIQTFFQQAQRRQFARDFLFRVKQINLAGNAVFNGETDLVYARSAALPGRTIENKAVNYFGQQFNVPGKSSYDNSEGYSINFYHEENIDLRKRFEQASRAVFNNDTSTGDYYMPGTGDTITLSVLNKDLEEISTITLVGASIRNIGEISHEIADGTGEILNFPVTFSYHFYQDFSA